MAKITTSDFGAIHDALNKMIIGEVKEALKLVPGKEISTEGNVPLCRIVVSDNGNYQPEDIGVTRIWLGDDGMLRFQGFVYDHGSVEDASDWDEDCADWLDITDFHYLIEQLKEEIPDENIPVWAYTMSLRNYSDMNAVREAAEKYLTY